MDNAERIVKGIWFPIEIWEADDLDWNEKILLLEIDSFTSKGMDCFMSNEYIADFLKVSEWKAGQMVNDLINKGYVIKTKFDGRRRYIESNIISSLAKIQEQPCEKQKADFGKSNPNYNKYNNDSTNHLNNKGVRFVKPTLYDVQTYCLERGNTIDPQAFIDFYESNGWMVGKNRMKDWKAAVRTWESRNTTRPKQPVKKQSNLERLNAMAAEIMGDFKL
jgi:hypothetical protein